MKRYRALAESGGGNYSIVSFLFKDKDEYERAVKLLNDNDIPNHPNKMLSKYSDYIQEYISMIYKYNITKAIKLFKQNKIDYDETI